VNTVRPRWPFEIKLVVSLLVLTLFVYLIFRFSAVIPPLILAVILAYILSPIANRLQERLRLPRVAATFLVYLLLLILAAILPLVLAPPLVAQFNSINVDLQLMKKQTDELLGHQFTFLSWTIDGAAIVNQIGASFQVVAEPFIGQTLVFLVDVISSVIWVIFILVVSFYLVKDGPALREWLSGLPPPAFREDTLRLRDEINVIWGSFFRGQLVLALVVAIIFIVIGFILGLPFALVMGILAGLLEFLPSIGHGIWLTIAVILSLSLGSTWIPLPNWAFTLLITGLHLLFQQFDLNYLIPRIIGRSVHLPPLVVILGIVAGAVMAGVLGIPLAAPTIASARVIGRYIYANLFDLDPFHKQPTNALPESKTEIEVPLQQKIKEPGPRG
jgi:predicted PurR-regulated permease PerM